MSETDDAVVDLFRRESGRITAWLLRRFGATNFALVEDAVQDALIAALRTWRIGGLPADPAAWLAASARNALIDRLRQAGRRRLHADREGEPAMTTSVDDILPGQTEPLADDLLMLMFVCAHPALSPAAQIALMARSVCGFSVAEIAAALHEKRSGVAQRLVRAKARLGQGDLRFEWPEGDAFAARRDAVLAAIHMMFSAGHRPLAGDAVVDPLLCAEALRLVELVAADARTRCVEAHALAAAIALHHARHRARSGPDGMPVTLDAQDRSRWDGSLIARGFAHLQRAIGGPRLTRWHLEAEIAALHAVAPSIVATDWTQILRAYDDLLALTGSPAVMLNRAIALAWRDGPAAGLAALEVVSAQWRGEDACLLHAALAELHGRNGDAAAACRHWGEASLGAANGAERRFFEFRLRQARSVVDAAAAS